jgi:hypothetical protein
MKMRTIKVTPKFLIDALIGKTTSVATNLPGDAQLLDIKFDLSNNQVSAVVRSDSFEDVAELYPIPELKLNYSILTAAKTASQPTQPASTVKMAPQSTTSEKPAQPTKMAIKMEGEFSPDQRKLLSFKIEGEYVIVKPVQFLKEEWEDINETVRSLGGKWVKGDIISYWQIPVQ